MTQGPYEPPPGGWAPPPGYGGYQQPPYGYGPTTDGKAIGALVAAILAWVVCPIIPAIVALILASQSKRDIIAARGALTGESLLTAARITAWVNIAIYGVMALFLVPLLLVGG